MFILVTADLSDTVRDVWWLRSHRMALLLSWFDSVARVDSDL